MGDGTELCREFFWMGFLEWVPVHSMADQMLNCCYWRSIEWHRGVRLVHTLFLVSLLLITLSVSLCLWNDIWNSFVLKLSALTGRLLFIWSAEVLLIYAQVANTFNIHSHRHRQRHSYTHRLQRHTHINMDTDIGLLFWGREPETARVPWHFGVAACFNTSMKLCVQLHSNYRTLIYLTCCLTSSSSSSSSNGGREHGRVSCCPFKCVHPFKSLISFWHFALAFGISLILLKSCQCHAHNRLFCKAIHIICWPLATPTLMLFIYLFVFFFLTFL